MININSFDWPQYVWMAIVVAGIIQETINHGKPMGEYNAYVRLVAQAIRLMILAQGGFFK